jgi:hypothetical protein
MDRLILLYSVSDDDLAAIRELAHTIVLPIAYGGGSNLKTAEAIGSGAFVVGNPSAYRDFEEYLIYPQVLMATSDDEFVSSVRNTFSMMKPDDEITINNIRNSISWEKSLAKVTFALNELLD